MDSVHAGSTSLQKLFLELVKINSRSHADTQVKPSSAGQVDVITYLHNYMRDGGVPEGIMSRLDDGSMIVRFEGFGSGKHLCFSAHVDTYFGTCGYVTPRIYENISGGDIHLPEKNTIISAEDLSGLEGCTLVTSSGDSLLGGDNKVGCAVMARLAIAIAKEEFVPAGPVTFWFGVDEELGYVDAAVLPEGLLNSVDLFVTIDGEEGWIVDTNTFCGWRIDVEFFGKEAHASMAGEKLKPAHYAVAELMISLENSFTMPTECGRTSRDGYVYVTEVSSMATASSRARIEIRDFNPDDLKTNADAVLQRFKLIARRRGLKFEVHSDGMLYTCTKPALDASWKYVNLVTGLVQEAFDRCEDRWVRGGVIGSMLNVDYPKMPVINIGTGTRNSHGLNEFVVWNEVQKVYLVVEKLIGRFGSC